MSVLVEQAQIGQLFCPRCETSFSEGQHCPRDGTVLVQLAQPIVGHAQVPVEQRRAISEPRRMRAVAPRSAADNEATMIVTLVSPTGRRWAPLLAFVGIVALGIVLIVALTRDGDEPASPPRVANPVPAIEPDEAPAPPPRNVESPAAGTIEAPVAPPAVPVETLAAPLKPPAETPTTQPEQPKQPELTAEAAKKPLQRGKRVRRPVKKLGKKTVRQVEKPVAQDTPVIAPPPPPPPPANEPKPIFPF